MAYSTAFRNKGMGTLGLSIVLSLALSAVFLGSSPSMVEQPSYEEYKQKDASWPGHSDVEGTPLEMELLESENSALAATVRDKLEEQLRRSSNYSDLKLLEEYLLPHPELIAQFPSAVPLEKGDYWISSPYGIRYHPISKTKRKHYGIDLAAAKGKPVHASAAGKVMAVAYSKNGYGTHIIIKHRFGFETFYGHLETVLVDVGAIIKQHQKIGTVGRTGTSTGFHLHYEIQKNGVQIDPMASMSFKWNVHHQYKAKADEEK